MTFPMRDEPNRAERVARGCVYWTVMALPPLVIWAFILWAVCRVMR